MGTRFTIDGNEALECHLAATCEKVAQGVQAIIAPEDLQAIVLGGGYGRGQGGVLKTSAGDQPYNDLEFYIFIHGHRLWNQHRFASQLNHFGESISPAAGLHVEFKIDSCKKLSRAPVTMFSYDLVTRHRIVFGRADLFANCRHHLDEKNIPVSEATRLLFNRCTGLLLAKEMLSQSSLTEEQSDFIGRNLAKAQLALGDAFLTVFGQYHWDVRERGVRLRNMLAPELPGWLETVREHHAEAVEFKLHPRRIFKSQKEFEREHQVVAGLALELWLWLESRRLNCGFASVEQYALHPGAKCFESPASQNLLLNLRTFGWRAVLDPLARRYPRERLFNALALLLWKNESETNPEMRRNLQRQLHSQAVDWAGLVGAYKQIWPAYG